MRRRRGQGPSLDDKLWYRVGNLSIVNQIVRGNPRTKLNLLFDPVEVQRFLESKWLNHGSEFTRMDIIKIVRGLNKRGRIRLDLGLPYPPPSVAEAWRRAHHQVDEWLEYDLAPQPKTELVVPEDTPPAPKVHEAWKEYYAHRTRPNSTLTKAVKDNEAGYWLNHFKPYFGNKLTTQVSPQDLKAWVDQLGKRLAPGTVLVVWRCFKRLFNWLVDLDKSDMFVGKQPSRTRNAVSPFDLVKNPERPALMERVTYSQDEVQALISTVQRKDPTLVFLLITAITTGMRISEILGLHWKDVTWTNGDQQGYLTIRGILCSTERKYIKRGKTKNAMRVVPMSQMLEDALWFWKEKGHTIDEVKANLKAVAKLRKKKKRVPVGWTMKPRPLAKGVGDNHFIFVNSLNENHLSYNTARARLLAAKKAAGIEHRRGEGWHEFRHAFISWAMARKVDAKMLQLTVGHSDMKTTMRYTHLVEKDRTWVNDLYKIDTNFVGEVLAPPKGKDVVFEDQPETKEVPLITVENQQDGNQMGISHNLPITDSTNPPKNIGFSRGREIGVRGLDPTNGNQMGISQSDLNNESRNLLKTKGFFSGISYRGETYFGMSENAARFITTKTSIAFTWSVSGVSESLKVERFLHENPRGNS